MQELRVVEGLFLTCYLKPEIMKVAQTSTSKAAKRQAIAEAMRASFRIEGITISAEQARATLRKVEASLGKASE
ncbi:hypothetical protein [Hymenobacter antarcticus]